MEIESLSQFIKKALEHYDNQKMKYRHLINIQDVRFNETTDEISFYTNNPDKPHISNFEMLGYFDNQTHIWIWGWLLGELDVKRTKICRELLNYGLKIEAGSNSLEHFFIKSLLVNSRIAISEENQLDVNLAIYSYLSRDKYSFIYPRKRFIDDKKTLWVTFYYVIK